MNAVMKANGGGTAIEAGAVRQNARGRFAGTGSLTEQQSRFIAEYVRNGANGAQAAKVAGYSAPVQAHYDLMRNPNVLARLATETERYLCDEGQVKAARFMVTAMDNEKLPGAVRFQAAKWVLENSGHGLAAQRAALGLPDTDKPLSEMSVAELDAFLHAGLNALDSMKRAQSLVIEGNARNVTSDGVAAAAQVLDCKGDHDK